MFLLGAKQRACVLLNLQLAYFWLSCMQRFVIFLLVNRILLFVCASKRDYLRSSAWQSTRADSERRVFSREAARRQTDLQVNFERAPPAKTTLSNMRLLLATLFLRCCRFFVQLLLSFASDRSLFLRSKFVSQHLKLASARTQKRRNPNLRANFSFRAPL